LTPRRSNPEIERCICAAMRTARALDFGVIGRSFSEGYWIVRMTSTREKHSI
jgi:hypothetical protein